LLIIYFFIVTALKSHKKSSAALSERKEKTHTSRRKFVLAGNWLAAWTGIFLWSGEVSSENQFEPNNSNLLQFI